MVRLIRRREVQHRLGVGHTTLYRLIRAGHLPKPIRLNPNSGPTGAVAWPESEIDAYVEARLAARDAGQ